MLLGQRPITAWIAEYERSHQHPWNRRCHAVGIPLITVSLLGAPLILVAPSCGPYIGAAFLVGWALQFLGHAIEGRPPEFFRDWRFMLVGLRWWLATYVRPGPRQ